MDAGIISSVISVFISLGIVLITYVKTWVRLESSVQNLSKVIERLSLLLDNLTDSQMKIAQDVKVLEARINNLEHQVEREHQG